MRTELTYVDDNITFGIDSGKTDSNVKKFVSDNNNSCGPFNQKELRALVGAPTPLNVRNLSRRSETPLLDSSVALGLIQRQLDCCSLLYAHKVPQGGFVPMSTNSECLGWDYELGTTLTDEHIRKVGGYKKPKLKLVFAQCSRPEIGGIDNIRIPLAVCNQVVGRLIHISDLADRVEGFNAWKMLKNNLTLEHNAFKLARATAGENFDIRSYTGKMDWKFGREIRAGDELRFESERLLGYMYIGLVYPTIPLLWGERVPHPLDRTRKSHRFVMYYDASLATMGIWFCHPLLKEAFFMNTQPDFRSFHISALELLTMVWGMWKLGKWARSVGMSGPLLLCAYGDNSSVPLVIHKTFAKSYGMEFIMDLKRWVTRTFDIDVHYG